MQYPTPSHDALSLGHPVVCTLDLSALRASLLRFARSRLRNATLAEDAVSETLLAAWQASPSFATEAQATGWIYGILRHKLVDQLRQQAREAPAGDSLPEADTRSPDWFVGGAWCGVTSVRAEPDQACSHRQLLALVLLFCEQLPPVQRQAFVMRELHDGEPADICRQLGVTEGHLWVLVHRARVKLRALLCQVRVFPPDAGQARLAPPAAAARPVRRRQRSS